MKRHMRGTVAVAMCVVIALLASTAVPSYAQRGGGSRGAGAVGVGAAPGGGSHGGGGSWHGGGGTVYRGGYGGHAYRGAYGGHAHRGGYGGSWRGGGWGWWGPSVVLGAALAAPFWGYPYGYPYAYPYGYPYAYPYGYPAYSSPVVVDSSPQTYIQQDIQVQQLWYYCQNPQGYYPYVQECPGGWQPVSPQPPLPPR